MNSKNSSNGFTLIELLITLSVMAICFLPLMRMFSASLEQVYAGSDLTTARYLAAEGMEKLKNLGFTQAQMENVGSVWEPALGQPPMEFNNKKWRVLRKIASGTDPLEVRIQVYQESAVAMPRPGLKSGKPIVELTTLIEDLDWTPIE